LILISSDVEAVVKLNAVSCKAHPCSPIMDSWSVPPPKGNKQRATPAKGIISNMLIARKDKWVLYHHTFMKIQEAVQLNLIFLRDGFRSTL